MKVVVGVDAGGTKAAVRVETLDGVPRADVEYPAEGWEASPVDTAAAWLAERVHRAVPAGDSVVALGVGAQGCDTAAHCTALGAALGAALDAPAAVVNDAALLVPAAGLRAGIGLIAGTGSIAVGTDAGGDVLFAGGWGWVLGDEGSAPALVREATIAVLDAHDRGTGDDGLASCLMDHFGVTGPEALARAVNDEPTPAHWGAAAVAVFRAAELGSELANRVVDDAARALVELVRRLVARGAVGDTVVAAGSVLVHQRRLAERVRVRLGESLPRWAMRVLTVPPVVGGVVLARRLAESD
ncbi:MAG TPA: BadF/BadG/BcrA/BcrD ATPase family protein [Pseudonocardiaceae bacterium]|jgi:N-acetylglucosamine kinase-like BadF-type ATPase|nr:BadF/BadG/BcrA/BcrD ATPase family protein [Pseudonocardiaceae bacterium]